MTTDELLTAIRAQIAQMAPHQKERRAGQLLIEAEKEIERLRLEVGRLSGKILGCELEEFGQVRILRDALKLLYEEQADYIRVNHLCDVHHNRSMQMARDALAATKPT